MSKKSVKPKVKRSSDAKKVEQRNKAKARRLWVCFRLKPEELERIEQFQRNHFIYSRLLGRNHGTDHNHKTGLIRGRLDWRINRAYGLLEKACPNNLPDVLRALALYHEYPPAEIALGEKKYGLIGQAKYKRKMVYGPPEIIPKKKRTK